MAFAAVEIQLRRTFAFRCSMKLSVGGERNLALMQPLLFFQRPLILNVCTWLLLLRIVRCLMLKKTDAEVSMYRCCGGRRPWKVLHEARGAIRGFCIDQKRSKADSN